MVVWYGIVSLGGLLPYLLTAVLWLYVCEARDLETYGVGRKFCSTLPISKFKTCETSPSYFFGVAA
jgi:hypothetical protein